VGDSDTLIEIAKSLGEVNGSMAGVHREMKGVRGEVRELRDEVKEMPDQWRAEAADIVENCRERRDELAEAKERGESTAVTNLAKEQARSRRPSTPPRKRDSWIDSVVKTAMKPVITTLVVVCMAAGAGFAVSHCSNGKTVEPADLKALEDNLLERFKKVNGGER